MTVHPLVVGLILLIAGGALSLVVYLVRNVGDLKAILIGADGQNGLRGDVRQVKQELKELAEARRSLGDAVHQAVGKIALVDLRVGTMEKRLHEDVKRLHDDLKDAKDEWDGTERRRPRDRS